MLPNKVQVGAILMVPKGVRSFKYVTTHSYNLVLTRDGSVSTV